MAKVLYDYQGFIQRIGGVSRYCLELITGLSNGFEAVLPNIWSDNLYLKERKLPHRSFLSNNRKSIKYNAYKALNMAQSIGYLRMSDYDIFHPLFYNPYFVGHTKKPVVTTIHDLNFDRFPSMLPSSELVSHRIKQICDRSDVIITVSDETKYDLMKYHKIPEKKIQTVYLGMNQELITVNKPRIHEKEYLLYIGARGGYKNFPTFLKGFSLLRDDIDLVCTGTSFNPEEKGLIGNLGIEKRVYQQFVSDADLYNLLYYAEGFVYPSLGEGFGIPILEAFRSDCPCFVSDIMCFHEVAGDAAFYFNQTDADSIAKTITDGLSDSQALLEKCHKGQEQLKKFTWEKTLRETEEIYRKLV